MNKKRMNQKRQCKRLETLLAGGRADMSSVYQVESSYK
jgi:hypothetical protein